MFVTKRNWPNELYLHSGGKSIEIGKEIRILRLNINSSLKYTKPVREVASRAEKKLTYIGIVTHKLDEEYIKMMYICQVLPSMEYCFVKERISQKPPPETRRHPE